MLSFSNWFDYFYFFTSILTFGWRSSFPAQIFFSSKDKPKRLKLCSQTTGQENLEGVWRTQWLNRILTFLFFSACYISESALRIYTVIPTTIKGLTVTSVTPCHCPRLCPSLSFSLPSLTAALTQDYLIVSTFLPKILLLEILHFTLCLKWFLPVFHLILDCISTQIQPEERFGQGNAFQVKKYSWGMLCCHTIEVIS